MCLAIVDGHIVADSMQFIRKSYSGAGMTFWWLLTAMQQAKQ